MNKTNFIQLVVTITIAFAITLTAVQSITVLADQPYYDARDVEYLGNIGGNMHNIVISGTLAYVWQGRSLRIFDVSTVGITGTDKLPFEPMGSTTPISIDGNSSSEIGFGINGDYVFIFSDDGAFYVIDVSDSTNPLPVKYYSFDEIIQRVYVSKYDDYIYAIISDSLQILDTSDVFNIQVIGTSTQTIYGGDGAIDFADNYVYVADTQYLRIFNVSNPNAPQQVGLLEAPSVGEPVIRIRENNLYASWGSNLYIFDVSDRTQPTIIGAWLENTNQAYTMVVSNDRLYLGGWSWYGMTVFDIHDPTQPTKLGVNGISVTDMVADSQYLYVIGKKDFSIFDLSNVSDDTNLEVVEEYYSPNDVFKVVIKDNYVYALSDNGLHIIDTKLSTQPKELGYFYAPVFGGGLALNGNYAYFRKGSWPNGLYIVDISDPITPTKVAFIDSLPDSIFEMTVSDGYLYIATGADGLLIADVTNPVTISVVSNFSSPDAKDVVVSGHFAYLLDSNVGLRVLDISDHTNPIEIGNYTPATGAATTLTYWGGYIYLGTEKALHIIDVYNTPNRPTEIGVYYFGNNNYVADIVRTLHYAYIANSYGGVRVIDVQNPSSPQEVGYSTLLRSAQTIGFNEIYAYAGGWDGIFVFHYLGHPELDHFLYLPLILHK